MIKRLPWMKRLFAVGAALMAVSAAGASASVHVTYDVHKQFPGGMSASWVHSATLSPINGTSGNGAYFNGQISSDIDGVLEGDLSGNTLSNASGSLNGYLKQLSNHLGGTMSTPFELRLGGESGGTGALEFGTDGAGGSGPFTGGYLDFALMVGGDSVLNGTLFFKPQAETASTSLSPNRGDSTAFTLWGWNWMHDGAPMDGATEPVWASFLSGLGYVGSNVSRSSVAATLGIALYVSDPDPPLDYAAQPEPTTFLIWGVLAMIGLGYCRRER